MKLKSLIILLLLMATPAFAQTYGMNAGNTGAALDLLMDAVSADASGNVSMGTAFTIWAPGSISDHGDTAETGSVAWALENYSHVYAVGGDYNVDTAINPPSGTKLEGAGYDTNFYTTATDVSDVFRIDSKSDIVLESFRVTGNRANQSDPDPWTDNLGNGIQLIDCERIYIDKIESTNNFFHGIFGVNTQSNISVKNCNLHENGFRGLHFHGTAAYDHEGNSFIGNHVWKNGRYSLVDLLSATYKWTASGSGTNEYYLELSGGGDPSISDPYSILLDDVPIREGGDLHADVDLGGMPDHSYEYGDNDTLGYNTVYVRDDTGDPDTSGVTIEHNSSYDTGFYPVFANGSNILIADNVIHHEPYVGFNVRAGFTGVDVSSRSVTMRGNIVYKCYVNYQLNGSATYPLTEFIFSGNISRDSALYGVALYEVSDGILSQNIITDSYTRGVYTSSFANDRIIFSENYIARCLNGGILFNNVNQSMITANQVVDCVDDTLRAAQVAISLANVDYSTISQNFITAPNQTPTQSAIYDDSDCSYNKVINNTIDWRGSSELNITGPNTIVKGNTGAESAEPQLLTAGAGQTIAVGRTTRLNTVGGIADGTLGSGQFYGQIKMIVMYAAGNNFDISITNHETEDPEVARFDAIDEYWLGQWTGTEWVTTSATCTFP